MDKSKKSFVNDKDVDKTEDKMKFLSDVNLNIGFSSKFIADQTPTPTRFIRNCEEVGLFQDLQNVNPFDETFRRAYELKSDTTIVAPCNSSVADDSLHTPHVFPNFSLDNISGTSNINGSAIILDSRLSNVSAHYGNTDGQMRDNKDVFLPKELKDKINSAYEEHQKVFQFIHEQQIKDVICNDPCTEGVKLNFLKLFYEKSNSSIPANHQSHTSSRIRESVKEKIKRFLSKPAEHNTPADTILSSQSMPPTIISSRTKTDGRHGNSLSNSEEIIVVDSAIKSKYRTIIPKCTPQVHHAENRWLTLPPAPNTEITNKERRKAACKRWRDKIKKEQEEAESELRTAKNEILLLRFQCAKYRVQLEKEKSINKESSAN